MAVASGSRLKAEFVKIGNIVPDVIESVHDEFLDMRVYYKEIEIAQGLAMRKSQTQMRPHAEFRGQAVRDGLYTLVMVDPDAPGPDDPKMRNFLHWMVINIPGSTLPSQEIWETGKEVIDYMGPAPPKGRHRYVFLLFKQNGELDVPQPESREKFDVNKFAKQYDLGKAMAGVYYLAQQHDELEPEHTRNQV